MAIFVFLCFANQGCWLFTTKPAPRLKSADSLPDDVSELFSMAEKRILEDSPVDELAVAVAALEKALLLVGEQKSDVSIWQIQWKLARACFLASEMAKASADKMAWISKAEDAAESAVRERPERVEGQYYLAVIKGRRAQYSGVGLTAMVLARKVENIGLKAVELDPSFDDGAPLRLLAMLYTHAPPWPTSIGDIDKALEYSQMAVELSDYPMNHLIRAEVLIEDDEYDDARAELKLVLAAPKVGRWAREGERWRPYARQLLDKLDAD